MTIKPYLKSLFRRLWLRLRGLKVFGKLESLLLKSLKPKPEPLRVLEDMDTMGSNPMEYQIESPSMATGLDTRGLPYPVVPTPPPALKVDTEIDFHGLENLEAYLEGTRVTPETLEKWVAAGILSPQETQVAEKLLKLMRKHAHT
jgi:hypothetical protein